MISPRKLVKLYLMYYTMVQFGCSKQAADHILYDTLNDWFNNDKNKVNCFITTQFNRIGYEMSIGKHDTLIKELLPMVMKELKEYIATCNN